jgi:hypothetical protein
MQCNNCFIIEVYDSVDSGFRPYRITGRSNPESNKLVYRTQQIAAETNPFQKYLNMVDPFIRKLAPGKAIALAIRMYEAEHSPLTPEARRIRDMSDQIGALKERQIQNQILQNQKLEEIQRRQTFGF